VWDVHNLVQTFSSFILSVTRGAVPPYHKRIWGSNESLSCFFLHTQTQSAVEKVKSLLVANKEAVST